MEAPKCRICGEKHWSRVCDDAKRVTKPSVTVTEPSVTPRDAPRLVAPSRLAALQAENEAQAAEIAMLKRALAKAHGGRPPAGEKAMTPAQRMKKLRAKKNNQPGVSGSLSESDDLPQG